MKKIYLLLTATFLLCLPCNKIMAQVPYKASVGGMYPALIAGGASYKTFLSDNFALQTDLLCRMVAAKYIEEKDFLLGLYGTIELNTNIMYQKKVKEKENFYLFWFIGCGGTLGFEFVRINGKFGANAILGLEFVFNKYPLAIQIDLRPGYGMLFNSGGKLNSDFFIPDTNPWHHFEWLIGIALRYTFKKKTSEQ